MTAPSVPGGQTGPAVVERVRVQVADRLTTDLRDLANKAGWPSQLVSQLTTVWTGMTWEVRIPNGVRSSVDALEYGTQTVGPNPVIRRFTARMGPLAERAAALALVNLGAEVLA